jgi:hypothetical protein
MTRQNVAFAAAEEPWEFVNVTVNELIAFAAFCTVKGMLRLNWLPYCADAGS